MMAPRRQFSAPNLLWVGLDVAEEKAMKGKLRSFAGLCMARQTPFPTYGDLVSPEEWGNTYQSGNPRAPQRIAGWLNSILGLVTSRAAWPDVEIRKFLRHFEGKYRDKAVGKSPRCWRVPSEVLRAFFTGLPVNTVDDWRSVDVNPEDIVAALDAAEVKVTPYKGFSNYRRDLGSAGEEETFALQEASLAMEQPTIEEDGLAFEAYDFVPPKSQASSGLYYRTSSRTWFSGPKGDIWTMALGDAQQLLAELCGLGLKWSEVEDLHAAQKLYMTGLWPVYRWTFWPVWRLDGGWDRLRRLLIGIITWFILETWTARPFRDAIMENIHFPYSEPQMKAFVTEVWRGPLISGDFKAFDQHHSPAHTRAAYQALQQLLNWPESLAVAMFLYYSFSPTLVTRGRNLADVMLHWRAGGNPSGTGVFWLINNMLNCWANWKTWGEVSIEPCEFGAYKGDDHLQPKPRGVGVAKWIATMGDQTGFRMDNLDTRVSDKVAIFCRDFYFPGLDGDVAPLVLSRARNVLFPERLDVPLELCQVLRCLRYRAASAPVHRRFGFSDIPQERQLVDVWDRCIAPYQHCMWDDFGPEVDLQRVYAALRHTVSTTEAYACEQFLHHQSFKFSWT